MPERGKWTANTLAAKIGVRRYELQGLIGRRGSRVFAGDDRVADDLARDLIAMFRRDASQEQNKAWGALARRIHKALVTSPGRTTIQVANDLNIDPEVALRALVRSKSAFSRTKSGGWKVTSNKAKSLSAPVQKKVAPPPEARRAARRDRAQKAAQKKLRERTPSNQARPRARTSVEEKPVYITGAGAVFHSTEHCHKLRAGQAYAINAGWHLTAVRRVSRSYVGRSRRPCSGCW